jgi:ankyrin repeat protein
LEEGKDTGVIIHGRKRTRQEIEKEIARNVSHKNRLQLLEDIATPEGVQLFTPGAEVTSTPIVHREVCLRNLPSVQLQRELQTLMYENRQIYKFDAFRAFNTPSQSSSQLSTRNSSPSVAKLLQMALGNEVSVAKSLYSFLERTISLTPYFPPVDTGNNVESSFHLQERSAIQFALQGLLQYFIILTNDGVLSQRQIQKGIEWLSVNLNDSFLSDLFSHETTTIKTFIRKIFPAVVADGNIKVTKYILKGHIDILNLTNHRHWYYDYTQQEECMSIAVTNGDSRMVELLCTAGFSPRILHYEFSYQKQLWDTENLEALQTLLSFGAHPECFIIGTPQGYPLIDAAQSGSREGVQMLLDKNSRVNVYVKHYFGTALQAAVWAENLEMAGFLITCGADINAPSGTQYQIPTPNDCICIEDWKAHMQAYWAMKSPVQIACAKNNVPLVGLLLNHGANVNFSPLIQIDSGDSGVYLVFSHPLYCNAADYSPHRSEIQFLTALQHSVQNGNISLVRLLLSNKADPNLRAIPDWEDTPLQLSIRLDYPEIAQVLIEFGANVNASPGEFNGRTALQAVAESGNIQIAQALLRRGADINAPPGYGKGLTALQAAIRMGHLLMADFLCISGAIINAPPAPENGLTAIQAATEIGDLNLVNDLILQGADIKNAAARTKTMMASISHKNLPMLELLVKFGAPINLLKDDDNMPPIVASARAGWIDGLRYLLDNGADINSYYFDIQKADNISALAWSINNRDIKMINLLLTRGASIHFPFAINPYNDSLCLALHIGCSAEIINRLIDEYAKADPFILDQEVLAAAVCNESDDHDHTRTAKILNFMSKLPKSLYMAQVVNAWNKVSENLGWLDETEGDANQVIKLLLQAGADINSRHPLKCFTLLQRVIQFNGIEMARWLIEKGAEIQVPASSHTGTPLQEAIGNDETEFVHFLLERGADINAPPAENDGVTALQAAASTRNRSLALVLLERGAEVNAPPAENYGITALQAAAIEGSIDIAIDLLQHGAHVAVPGAPKNGRTAIEGAAEHGNEDMLQLLLNHYDGSEDLRVVCESAATYAQKGGHVEIASWLRRYPNL